jgi:hypothetical protein
MIYMTDIIQLNTHISIGPKARTATVPLGSGTEGQVFVFASEQGAATVQQEIRQELRHQRATGWKNKNNVSMNFFYVVSV